MNRAQILTILGLPILFCLGIFLWQANPLFVLVPLGLTGVILLGLFIAFIVSAELTTFDAWDLLIRSVLFRLGFKVQPPKSLEHEEHEHHDEAEIDLNQVLAKLMAQLGAERGYIALKNPESGELEFRVGQNIDKERLNPQELLISNHVAEKREAIASTNAASDPRYAGSESITGYSLRSIAAAPLIVSDKLIGVVYLDNRIMKGVFGNEELKALTDFVQENAQAIEKASQNTELIVPSDSKVVKPIKNEETMNSSSPTTDIDAEPIVDEEGEHHQGEGGEQEEAPKTEVVPSESSIPEPELSSKEDAFGGDIDDEEFYDDDSDDEAEAIEKSIEVDIGLSRPGKPITSLPEIVEEKPATPDFENMSPEELMTWLESMAVRLGKSKDIPSSAEISEDDPRLTNPDYAPGYTIWKEHLAREREKNEANSSVETEAKPLAPKQTHFTAYYPRQAAAKTEYGFYVYAHLLDALIETDIQAFSTELGGRVPKAVAAEKAANLQEGALVAVMIRCDKLKFNQMGAIQVWKAPFVRFDFKFTADEALIDEIVEGRVAILLGIIEIASIDFKISVGATSPLAALNALPEKPSLTLDASATIPPYQKIFVSYSRKDTIVAEQYRAAQTMLGNTIFMDVHSIRAGEDWDEALRRFISEADVFQLFWSEHSATSDHVRFEWEYALNQRCPDTLCRQFIRPTYWQKPMPQVPEPLNHLHFAYVEVRE